MYKPNDVVRNHSTSSHCEILIATCYIMILNPLFTCKLFNLIVFSFAKPMKQKPWPRQSYREADFHSLACNFLVAWKKDWCSLLLSAMMKFWLRCRDYLVSELPLSVVVCDDHYGGWGSSNFWGIAFYLFRVVMCFDKNSTRYPIPPRSINQTEQATTSYADAMVICRSQVNNEREPD